MRPSSLHGLLVAIAATLLCAGCQEQAAAPVKIDESKAAAAPVNPEIEAAINELSPEDQVAARAQGFCAYADDSPLGSMGAPFKLVINDQTIFLCCEGCKSQVLKDPEATLAKVAQLKAKVQAEKN
jgi:hypothetical protein